MTAGEPVHTLSFEMASRRDAVGAALERILAAVAVTGLSEDRRHNLAVAVTEALSNAAVHGNRLAAHAVVRVRVEAGAQGAMVEIEDSGPGFDRERVADPTDGAGLLATGGRGVFLMNRLVDRLEYNDSGNRVRLFMENR